LSEEKYEKQLEKHQGRLSLLYRQFKAQGRSMVLVFEGWDAAGKGGIIRRITAAMDARDYRVIPIAAPTEEERAHHYLWRFWRQIPGAGRTTIFDRSWYGRVLVERVEGFATEAEWTRAYAEIVDFEQQLYDHRALILKFWIHIDSAEQLERFRSRQDTPYKDYKITEEDYRNRERRNDYELAANEMLGRTWTEYAPWHLVEGNDKRFARIKVLKIICDQLEKFKA
jgi:polyphosphate kinase 2 (PPK2 family)